MMIQSKWMHVAAAVVLVFGLALMAGCKGDTGPAGASGTPGDDGQPGQDLVTPVTGVKVAIGAITVPTPAGVEGTAVEFTVTDLSDKLVTSLPTGANVYFTYAKLTTDSASGLTAWSSYIIRDEISAPTSTFGPGGAPVLASALQANRQTATTAVVNLGAGKYRYTFTNTGLTSTLQTTPVAFDTGATNRIAIQVSGGGLQPVNSYKDFIPAGGTPTVTRKIATTASCLECHEGNFGFHDSGARIEVEYCVTCHNPGSTDANSGHTVDMANMIHKIHRGLNLPSVVAGGEYAIWGFGNSKHDYSEVGYPQDIKNCIKCHNVADTATPDGDNWKNKPSRRACGACHDNVSFVDPLSAGTTTRHIGGTYSDDNECASCHKTGGIAPVETSHLTENVTTNNPGVPAGAANFTYEISKVTVNGSNQPVVTFRVLKDGVPVVFNAYTGTTNAEAWTFASRGLLTDFAGSPSFLVAYADGTATTIDYNNVPRAAAQPASVSIAELVTGASGSLVSSTDTAAPAGSYDATIIQQVSRSSTSGAVPGSTPTSSAAFPVGSKMRTVGLQGYFTQTNLADYPYTGAVLGGATASGGLARHAISVTKIATGDTARREVVDNAKCAKCHEWLELHGGNRVYDTQICVMCHNPNLSSSGRGAALGTAVTRLTTGDTANGDLAGTQAAALTANGFTPANPLTYPEATNNLKDMVHGIHASHARTSKYQFVRDRGSSGIFYYDWSHVTYPSELAYCEMCHKPGTYSVNLPTGVLATTNVTGGDGLASAMAVTTARASLPNTADLIISPISATCYACHDSAAAKAHMSQNGGYFGARSGYATFEACAICHGAGRSEDVSTVHK